MSYKEIAKFLKVLADPNRLEILDLLSCEALCAHDLLGYFQFSQPTLSHHMKVLSDSELITMRKVGNKRMYKLNHNLMTEVTEQLVNINTNHVGCVCNDINGSRCNS
ncbi:ArsR family transcriptional regulator [Staphylococcus gallinarum]|uniref:ArsR family transcriptional regulator n=1 Tax=Staphylococcus gallinarum TaxID=1293 RepID=A0A3A0VR45_STAGA|nr:metalloregulator ArsR/SmtB family transcription factor [Staphylococcus gallinarum]RIP35720.1 ArsR family transcriptional regulator [Staphylococcus gallinarum]